MIYWGIELGQLAPNGIQEVVAFILICKAFGIPTNLEVFRSIFDVKQVEEGPQWHIFQKKNVAGSFIVKLPICIHDWNDELFFLSDGQEITSNPWNMRRVLPNYKVESKRGFIEESMKID